MIRFTRSVQLYQDAEGKNPDEAAPVRVLIFGTATEATIFSDDAGTIPLAQPFLTNLLSQENPGQFTFVVSDGTYDIEVNGVIALASEQIFSQAVIPVLPDIDIDNIRYSKLQNPLLSILKKNKLEDVIAGSLTWTRSTTATYVDRYGIIQTAAIDEPRQEAAGWLIEGTSENLCLRSEEFDNATWSKNGVTVSANSTTAPDLNSTADTLIPTAANQQHTVLQTIMVTSGGIQTFSVFVKSGGLGFIQLAGSGNVSTEWFNVDLSDGSIGNNNLSSSNALVETLASGWFRVSLTFISTATGNGSSLLIPLQTDVNSRNPVFTGDAVNGVHTFGAIQEILPFSSSYIPTVASSVVRGADIVSVQTQNNFITSVEGDHSTSFSISFIGDTGFDQRIYSAKTNGGSENRFDGRRFSGTNLIGFRDGSSSLNLATSVLQLSTTSKLIFVTSTDVKGLVYQDGIPGSEISINPVETLDTSDSLFIGGSDGGSFPMYGHIYNFEIYDFALNADEVKFIS